MQIVRPSVKLIHITPDAEKLIERCGRVCYKSEDKITEESSEHFIYKIMKSGHHSVIEHASATVNIVCCRGISHEIVRHRTFSYSQESTRYCSYDKDKFGNEISVIRPNGLSVKSDLYFQSAMIAAEKTYFNMLKDGCSPQLARSVLPTALKTEIMATANFRNWLHFLNLRTNKAAHPQIREISYMIYEILNEKCPNIFSEENIERNCL